MTTDTYYLKTEEVLQLIAPPLALLDWLDAHQAKHGSVPTDILAWAQRWRDIRGDGDSVIDGRTEDVAKKVRSKVAA